MANEARSAELVVTSLISNKREWNNCFLKFLNKFEIRAKKARKSERNRKKLEDAMLCNTSV